MIAGIDAASTGSINFHKKFGFKDGGVVKNVGYKFNKWLDVMFMQLELNDCDSEEPKMLWEKK